MLSEKSDKKYDITYLWNLKNRYKLTYLKNINRLANTENKLVVTKSVYVLRYSVVSDSL